MSILERTIQSVIFELGAILIGMLVIEFIPHEGQHAVLFEGLLLAATVPMSMYMMSISLWMAFITDISMTLIILVYTYVYNWGYDRVRLFFVKA